MSDKIEYNLAYIKQKLKFFTSLLYVRRLEEKNVFVLL
jgi:hypothetical protein